MEHLRERLDAAGILSSQSLALHEDGAPTLVAGLVIVRQHPATAKGTVFLLLEDEAGYINVIVPPRIYEKNRELVRLCPFLIVEGVFERQETVLNVVAKRFRRLEVKDLSHRSRDFR